MENTGGEKKRRGAARSEQNLMEQDLLLSD